MIDIKVIRQDPEKVQAAIDNKGIKDININEFLEIDSLRVDLMRRVEQHRSLRNNLSRDIAKIKDVEKRDDLIKEATHVKQELSDLENEFTEVSTRYTDLIQRIPNIPSPEMPVGREEEDNEILKVWFPMDGYMSLDENNGYFDYSYIPEAAYKYKDHVELGELLDIIDVKQSAVVSGARFCYLKNEAVLIQDAVFSLLKSYLQEKGFMPLVPPILVKERSLYGTSHFPEGEDQVYKIENTNIEDKNSLYLVGSSEPANFSYFMDKTLDISELPIKLYAQTTCFRSEVGSWGKDVRGIKRVHQFDKLEMNSVCHPSQSRSIFDEFLSINEWLLQQLQLPYRVVNHCTGDSGYNASYLQYDIEVWRPGEREYMEVMTDTMTTDYQARRLGIRFKDNDTTDFVHTVNDTGAAMGRLIIAILENHQKEDGTVEIPEALHKYLSLTEIVPRQSK